MRGQKYVPLFVSLAVPTMQKQLMFKLLAGHDVMAAHT